MDPMQNRGRRPETKRPRPVAAGDFFGSLIGPRCLCQFFGNLIGVRCLCQNSLARGAIVLDAGPLLEPPVPPLLRLRAAPGP